MGYANGSFEDSSNEAADIAEEFFSEGTSRPSVQDIPEADPSPASARNHRNQQMHEQQQRLSRPLPRNGACSS